MQSIQDMISEYCQETGLAHTENREGGYGVVFHDEGEFIPMRDLGYSGRLGFYRLSAFPDVANEASYNTWTIHPIRERHPDPDHPWQPYALLDSDGFGYILGERWQVEELLPVLKAFLDDGVVDEPIDDDDEALGTRWLTISEAVEEAHAFDSEKYTLTESTDYRIRQAARRGNWLENGKAKQDSSGRWKFHARRFRGWLVANRGRTNDIA